MSYGNNKAKIYSKHTNNKEKEKIFYKIRNKNIKDE
jgi:hypothetical protein